MALHAVEHPYRASPVLLFSLENLGPFRSHPAISSTAAGSFPRPLFFQTPFTSTPKVPPPIYGFCCSELTPDLGGLHPRRAQKLGAFGNAPLARRELLFPCGNSPGKHHPCSEPFPPLPVICPLETYVRTPVCLRGSVGLCFVPCVEFRLAFRLLFFPVRPEFLFPHRPRLCFSSLGQQVTGLLSFPRVVSFFLRILRGFWFRNFTLGRVILIRAPILPRSWKV